MAGIYIHIPFCKQACHYCDFHFSTHLENTKEMVASIAHELNLQKGYTGNEKIQTIYFGGGTPSLLNAEQLNLLLNSIEENYTIDKHPEITLEANPDDLDFEKLQALKTVGVNRLSIGVQSLNDEVLRYLNRPHSAGEAREAVQLAQQVGFHNISVDLIYAIPGQHEDDWRKNIREAIRMNIQHISSYSLTIEQKTAFGNWYAKGKITPVDDEETARQMELLIQLLIDEGFEQYEVSNFGLPGFHSKHNSSYWKQQVYLGVGPGAHSYNGVTRQFNIRNNVRYIKALKEGSIPFEIEKLTREDHVNEYLLTTLRTKWGANLNFLKKQYGYDVHEQRHAYLESLRENKLAVIEDDYLKLTRPGQLLADKISSDLFLEPNKI